MPKTAEKRREEAKMTPMERVISRIKDRFKVKEKDDKVDDKSYFNSAIINKINEMQVQEKLAQHLDKIDIHQVEKDVE